MIRAIFGAILAIFLFAQANAATPNLGAAVQGTTLLNALTIGTPGQITTVTLAGATGTRVCVREIVANSSDSSGNPSLMVFDGATEVIDFGDVSVSPTLSFIVGGAPLICGSTGNDVVVKLGPVGTSHISVVADRQ